MSVRVDAETLRALPIFADCDLVALQVLAFSAERQVFEPGEPILKQGYKGASAYLILSGSADTFADGMRGLGEIGPGTLLGELSMISQLPCGISATATTTVTAARISRSLFMRVAEEYPDFGRAVFAAMARKLDDTLDDIGDVQALFKSARSFQRS